MGSFPEAQTDDTGRVMYEAPKRSLFNNCSLSYSGFRTTVTGFCLLGREGGDSPVGIWIIYRLRLLSRTLFIFRSQSCGVGARSKANATLFSSKEATSITFVPQTRRFHASAAVMIDTYPLSPYQSLIPHLMNTISCCC